ncbi:ribose-phosphate pyrophosphokinase-like domain-containing protein [Rickettsia monacensis]|uniref:ribose-phosphate pyrophosphokinase-like domain-containing protein n=1 Tax=Rickettsia monacensis TaxID=109232 RepID=UPI000BB2D3C5|nr:ribose-phosphate pyrophosphokinase-like domain-containing protein [Rickettsia monacensis]
MLNILSRELPVEIQESFHNEDVIIVQSTSKPVNDRLIELFLLVVDAAKKKREQINALFRLCKAR